MLRRGERRDTHTQPAAAGRDLRARFLRRFTGANTSAMRTASDIRLQLLGDPKLEVADGAFPLERKDAGLLALLAVDGPIPRGKAAALLWPDVDDAAARNNLRQRLHRLRRRTGRDVAETASDVLRLAGDVQHDIGDLASTLADHFDAATGELLGELDYSDCEQFNTWVQAAREQWRVARRSALADIASRLEKDGHVALALQYAGRLVADDPLLEHAHRRLMRLHYLRGDRAAALAAFARCRDLLRRELGASPGRETLELAALIEASGALPAPTPAPRPVVLLRPPRLVGRDTEWRRLELACATRRFALVCGEPGIGKSRLLADFAARRPGTIVVGARPGDARVPFVLLARLLRAVFEHAGSAPDAPDTLDDWARTELARLLPELGAAPTARMQPVRLQQAVMAALLAASAGGAGPGAAAGAATPLAGCVVDDLHFADEPSLEMLVAIAGSEPGRLLQWFGSARTAEMPAHVADWLARADGDDVERIELGPLDVPAIEALLVSLALPGFDARAWAEPLARHTGGNPLFILETLSAALAQGSAAKDGARPTLPAPGTVGQLIERRLAQLAPEALRLARVAALAGQDFSVELAARVLRVHPLDLAGAWRELEAAQVIRDDAFAHDLVLEATLRSVPEPIARVLHRDIAAELEAQRAPAARVATHWQQAHAWSRAGAAFVAAAVEARRASQRAAEADLWTRAAECLDRAGAAADAFDARFRSIDALLVVHGVERARRVVDTLLETAVSPRQRVEALTARATACLMGADHAAGSAAARQALDLAATLDAPWLRFEAARLLAVGLAQQERASEALPVIEPFRELVEREGTLEQRGRFWADYAYVLNSARRLQRTAEALRRSIDIAREAGDFAEMATVVSNYALTLGNLGRIDEALEQSLCARALQARLGDTAGPASGAIDMYVGVHGGALGRYRDALASFDAALAVFAGAGQDTWVAVAGNHKAGLLIDLGQFGRAQKALDRAFGTLDSTHARREMLLARIARALGADGAAALARAVALLGADGDPYMTMLVRLEESLLLPAAEAATRCEQLQRRAEDLEYLGIAARALLLRARHLLRAGDADRAAAVLDAPAPHLRDVRPADMYAAEAWWIRFEVHSACGDRAAATTALARAVDWINGVALPNVPDEFKDSFLSRNAVNRAILTAASRRAAFQ